MENYLHNPVCSLAPYSYKNEAYIGFNAKTQLDTLCVLDKKAGPKFTRSEHVQEEVLRQWDTKRTVVNRRSASSHKLTVL